MPHCRTAASSLRGVGSLPMAEKIVITRKLDGPDWMRLRDAAVRSIPLTITLHPSEGDSGTFHVAPGGPTLTSDGVQAKFILQRVEEPVPPLEA
jgi:hypothetical protein